MTVDASTGAPAADPAAGGVTAPRIYQETIDAAKGGGTGDSAETENLTAEEAIAEIERLRAGETKWQALSKKHEGENKKYRKQFGPLPTETAAAGTAGAGDAASRAVTEENERLRQENLRLRVGSKKGLPANLINRLQGDDEESMEADADELLKFVAAPTRPQGNAGGGAGSVTVRQPSFGDAVRQQVIAKRGSIQLS